MATRSTIGYETQDGDYIGVYCHYAIVTLLTGERLGKEETESLR